VLECDQETAAPHAALSPPFAPGRRKQPNPGP